MLTFETTMIINQNNKKKNRFLKNKLINENYLKSIILFLKLIESI